MSLKEALSEIYHPFIIAYRWLADHLTKALGIIGTAILGTDLTGYLEGIKVAALKYLPPALADQISIKIGIALFVLVILRGWYTGWKARQLRAEAAGLPPPTAAALRLPDPVKVLFLALLIGTAASTCIAIAEVRGPL